MTKREFAPIGTDPRLDRRQPPAILGIGFILAVIALLVTLVLVGWGVKMALSQNQPVPTLAALPTNPPASPAPPTATIDAWGMTGTALLFVTVPYTPTSTPTLDYCWWQTPSPTPSPTWPYTPDAWGATGTAIYQAANPLQTATPAPLPLPVLKPQKTVSPTIELPAISPPPTWTNVPQIVPQPLQQQAAAPPPVANTGPPVVITSPPIIITAPPVIVQPPAEVIIVTATASPTASPMPITPTSTPTQTQPPTVTVIPTDTASPTLEPTPTQTPELTLEAPPPETESP